MSGGEIRSNRAKSNGGGVNVTGYGSFTLTGGTITDNTAPAGGGSGIFVSQYGATFTQAGGTVTGNHGEPQIKH
jgi:predicted outer membrane repeat protein